MFTTFWEIIETNSGIKEGRPCLDADELYAPSLMRSCMLAVDPKQLQKVMQSICKNLQQGHKATLPVGARSFLELQTY